MIAAWYRDLYKIGSAVGATGMVLRVALAVGIPTIGGVSLGHPHAGVAAGATALFVTLRGFVAFTMFLLFAVHATLAGDGGSAPHLLETQRYDVTVGCI